MRTVLGMPYEHFHDPRLVQALEALEDPEVMGRALFLVYAVLEGGPEAAEMDPVLWFRVKTLLGDMSKEDLDRAFSSQRGTTPLGP